VRRSVSSLHNVVVTLVRGSNVQARHHNIALSKGWKCSGVGG
jgi:hypothetical protein